ncbi:t-SNARE [Punctularia strigosozonata HHB-11173 SS5]|uniref:t-SNARE n=1 Tax=Punctularia strigosozonata (strain HHB-11173) TaxID=741275 RepID=UPI00044184C1|nr:t-SNARE [Punctularia strigosozonata HHB-11173 SS5]EIN07475.1 t-SNARE [Punctularia strigosozonata HHB-11173 SS5]
MARDRLAAMRAQQGGGGYTSSNDSYPTQASGGYGGGGGYSRRANPYAQQDDRSYEMSEVQDSRANLVPTTNYGGGGGAGDMTAFYDEISSIQDSLRTFNDNVSRIGDLHSRSLNNTDDAAAQRNQQQLDALVDETSALSSDLKKRIKTLERQGGAGRDGQIRKQQTGLVKSKFVEAIQNYQGVEQQYRQRYKQRMERQFKIVKPDATPEEVKAVVNDESGGQIFSQALMNSNRYGESRAAYREVQERHADIQRIERTLGELAQLFNDMSVLVEQQDEQINTIEATTQNVEKDTEAGLGYTEKAVDSARGARKKRWICFWITLVLIIIIVIIIVVKVVIPAINNHNNSSSGGGSKTVTASPSATATSS